MNNRFKFYKSLNLNSNILIDNEYILDSNRSNVLDNSDALMFLSEISSFGSNNNLDNVDTSNESSEVNIFGYSNSFNYDKSLTSNETTSDIEELLINEKNIDLDLSNKIINFIKNENTNNKINYNNLYDNELNKDHIKNLKLSNISDLLGEDTNILRVRYIMEKLYNELYADNYNTNKKLITLNNNSNFGGNLTYLDLMNRNLVSYLKYKNFKKNENNEKKGGGLSDNFLFVIIIIIFIFIILNKIYSIYK